MIYILFISAYSKSWTNDLFTTSLYILRPDKMYYLDWKKKFLSIISRSALYAWWFHAVRWRNITNNKMEHQTLRKFLALWESRIVLKNSNYIKWIIYMYTGCFFFHVHIFIAYGGMRTTLYGNFVLCKFKFCKKLQRFEFICEKTIFALKSSFFTKMSWRLA